MLTYITALVITVVIAILYSCFIMYPVMKEELQKRIQPDVSVEEMKELEARVQEFLNKNHLQQNASFDRIKDAIGIKKIIEVDSLDVKARLEADNATVLIRKSLTNTEKKFRIAHECGHIINRDLTPIASLDGHNKPKREQAADYVGAALLMPNNRVREYLNQKNYKNASRKQRIVIARSMSKLFEVDEITALRRILEVQALKDV